MSTNERESGFYTRTFRLTPESGQSMPDVMVAIQQQIGGGYVALHGVVLAPVPREDFERESAVPACDVPALGVWPTLVCYYDADLAGASYYRIVATVPNEIARKPVRIPNLSEEGTPAE